MITTNSSSVPADINITSDIYKSAAAAAKLNGFVSLYVLNANNIELLGRAGEILKHSDIHSYFGQLGLD